MGLNDYFFPRAFLARGEAVIPSAPFRAAPSRVIKRYHYSEEPVLLGCCSAPTPTYTGLNSVESWVEASIVDPGVCTFDRLLA
jgi:hypothetical protein